MVKVMEGIRVLEVAQFTFVPAAGAILAELKESGAIA
jgi:crotonobetainyl-CoA:carnitine CoA-transferase CaiB-like acyl-CoA transferase